MKSKQWFMHTFFAIGILMIIIGITVFSVILRKRNISNKSMRKGSIEISDIKFNKIINKKISENPHLDPEILALKMKIGKYNSQRDIIMEELSTNQVIVNIKREMPSYKVNFYIDAIKYPKLHKSVADLKYITNKRKYLSEQLDELVINPNSKQMQDLEISIEKAENRVSRIDDKIFFTNENLRKLALKSEDDVLGYFGKNREDRYGKHAVHPFALDLPLATYTKLTGFEIRTKQNLSDYFNFYKTRLIKKTVSLKNHIKDYRETYNDLDIIRLNY